MRRKSINSDPNNQPLRSLMTKYRLKKRFYYYDGTVIEPQELTPSIMADCYYAKNNGYYFRKEFVESNTEFFEKVTPKLWKPEQGQHYWFATPNGRQMVGEYTWDNDRHDNRLLERGFVFPTEEEAKAHAEYLIECSIKKRMEELEK